MLSRRRASVMLSDSRDRPAPSPMRPLSRCTSSPAPLGSDGATSELLPAAAGTAAVPADTRTPVLELSRRDVRHCPSAA